MAEAAGSDDEELAVAELAAYCESEERAMRKAKEAKSSKADSTRSIIDEKLAVEVLAHIVFNFFPSSLMRTKRCSS